MSDGRELAVSGGATGGAALGTMVIPGIGTFAGALGGAVGGFVYDEFIGKFLKLAHGVPFKTSFNIDRPHRTEVLTTPAMRDAYVQCATLYPGWFQIDEIKKVNELNGIDPWTGLLGTHRELWMRGEYCRLNRIAADNGQQPPYPAIEYRSDEEWSQMQRAAADSQSQQYDTPLLSLLPSVLLNQQIESSMREVRMTESGMSTAAKVALGLCGLALVGGGGWYAWHRSHHGRGRRRR